MAPIVIACEPHEGSRSGFPAFLLFVYGLLLSFFILVKLCEVGADKTFNDRSLVLYGEAMAQTHHSTVAAPVIPSTSTSTIVSQSPKSLPPGVSLELQAFGMALNVAFWTVLVIFIFRRRLTAGDSTRAKVCRSILKATQIILTVVKILLMIGFFPITIYCYLFLRCWNCGKIGHYARNCPEHWRCWSCGELGHHARFCTKHPVSS